MDSVRAQTYADMEVLIIIDGATDNSLSVCREYVSADSRFFVYEKPNGGAGAARNYAINYTTGDYILFMDSDDYWLDSNMIEKIMELLMESNADILSLGYSEFYNEAEAPSAITTGSVKRSEVYRKSVKDALSCLLKSSRKNFSSSIVTKCVKSSLIRENNIRFIESVNGEDVHFTAQLLIHAKSYDRLNEYTYAVRRHAKSTSRMITNSHKVAECMLVIFDDLFARYDLRDVRFEHVLDFLASPYLYALGKLAAAYNAELLFKFAKYQFVLKYATRFYVKLAGLFADIFGLKLLVVTLRVLLTHSKKSHVKIDTLAMKK